MKKILVTKYLNLIALCATTAWLFYSPSWTFQWEPVVALILSVATFIGLEIKSLEFTFSPALKTPDKLHHAIGGFAAAITVKRGEYDKEYNFKLAKESTWETVNDIIKIQDKIEEAIRSRTHSADRKKRG